MRRRCDCEELAAIKKNKKKRIARRLASFDSFLEGATVLFVVEEGAERVCLRNVYQVQVAYFFQFFKEQSWVIRVICFSRGQGEQPVLRHRMPRTET
jgi:hypothetical protein